MKGVRTRMPSHVGRANYPAFITTDVPRTITSMVLLEIIVQAIIDWVRDVLAGILGRRAEDFVIRYWKRRRKRGARRKKYSRK